MSEKRTSLEIIGPTVEEAVEDGLEQLGLPEDAVEIEILDPGNKGLFGLGQRQARVRLTIKSPQYQVKTETTPAIPMPAPMPGAVATELAEEWDSRPVGEVGEDRVLSTARQVVSELLQKMKVRARVNVHYLEAEEPSHKVTVWVDVRGDDLSFLIGPHADTLNAIQYITNLIVSKDLDQPVAVVVDVQGYRLRREQQVRQVARRMAEQAFRTGRRQVLEPMPANERRWVHIELRSNPNVTTESIGEDPRRKVTIIPKKKAAMDGEDAGAGA
jgi:spoIIIJ-associated protein